jgi:hypothetical protein
MNNESLLLECDKLHTALRGLLLSTISQDSRGFIQLSGIARANFDYACDVIRATAIVPEYREEENK